MTDDQPRDDAPAGDQFTVHISGDVSGQVAVGKHITQSQIQTALTPEFVAEMREALGGLRDRVAAEAPRELIPEALEELSGLEDELTEEEVDPEELPGRLERVRNWFIEHLPAMAGTVSSVVIHPIAGRLVQTVSEAAARSLGEKLGLPEGTN